MVKVQEGGEVAPKNRVGGREETGGKATVEGEGKVENPPACLLSFCLFFFSQDTLWFLFSVNV